MSTPQNHWDKIYTTYTQSVNDNYLKEERLVKIDELVYTDNIENIRNGLTLMTSIAPEYLCRYLEMSGDSVVLREIRNFSVPLLVERVLVESVKGEPMWQDFFESGAFESMHFRSLGDVSVENLTEDEKSFCVRMAKEMVRVPAGEFMMGALEGDEDAKRVEKPRHKVTLTRDFLLFKYQVTQALWESVMGSNPSHFKGANRPVVMVSWFDCVLFCNKLSELEGLEPAYDGLGDYQVGDDESMFEDEIDFFSEDITCNWTATGYRLPTEGEWEYSARANQNFLYAGSDNVDEVAWYGKDYLGDGGPGNSDGGTHPVGLKKPNGFGLYDMSGNVDEWVWDCFELNYYSSSPTVDPRGPNCDRDSGKYRLNRGGNCSFAARNARVSFRDLRTPNIKHLSLGFRPVRTP